MLYCEGSSPHLAVRDQKRDRGRRVMSVPVKFEIPADWDSLGNVPAARWGPVPPPFPQVANSGIRFQDRGGTHPKMAALGNCMEFLDFLGR